MSTTNETQKPLCDAIIEALVGAGVDGMDVDHLDDWLDEHYPDPQRDCVADSPVMDRLVADGVVEQFGCSWVRLTRAQWEQRVAGVLCDAGVVVGSVGFDGVAKVVIAALMPVSTEDAS